MYAISGQGVPHLSSEGGYPIPGQGTPPPTFRPGWGSPHPDLAGSPLGRDLGPVTGVPLPWKGHGTSGSIMGWRWGTPPSPRCGQTDTCENSTFPSHYVRGRVIKVNCIMYMSLIHTIAPAVHISLFVNKFPFFVST